MWWRKAWILSSRSHVGRRMSFQHIIQDSDSTASAANTLATWIFGDIDQDREDVDVISFDVVWERLTRQGV